MSSPSSADESALRRSTPNLGIVWFGASVSLAEILTGTFFAPLGFRDGMYAILLGHLIGGLLFWLLAYASARSRRGAMDTAKMAFGRVGGGLFAVANVVQLVGWTAVMVSAGAVAASVLVPALGTTGWSVVIGVLVVVWIAMDRRGISRIQQVVVCALFATTVYVCFAVFGGTSPHGALPASADIGFGAAVELAVAMPLSWLPVVGDYSRQASRPVAGCTVATLAYGIGSCWMFAIGLGCAVMLGTDDFAGILSASGLGVVGVAVVVFSTVTTTFLDAESAGTSLHALCARIDAKPAGIAAAVVGTLAALVAPTGDFEGFLYLIGSVFAPMAALVAVDVLALRRDASTRRIDAVDIALWAAGFIAYRLSMGWDIVVGNTLPVMCATALAAIVVRTVMDAWKRRTPAEPSAANGKVER